MNDASDDQPPEQAGDAPDEASPNSRDGADAEPPAGSGERERPSAEEVEERYDFESFGPADMEEMSYEEWDAAFDHDSWITGEKLLDRLEADLKSRVANRDVFAVVERIEREGEPRLVAYSDEGYAVVHPNGTVEGSGTVLRDVKPSVALASMESYEVPETPEGDVLPDPAEVPEGTGQLGNKLMQVVAAAHVVAGVALLLSGPLFGVSGQTLVIALVAGIGFLVFGGFAFLLVANARLSDRFRAEEYRNRLRAVGMADDERPEFLPGEGAASGEGEDAPADSEREADTASTGPERENEDRPDDAYSDDSHRDDARPDDTSERENGGPAGTGVSSASEGGT